MSVRVPLAGWMVVALAACSSNLDSPVAPAEPAPPLVPIQAGPPPTSTNNAPTVMIVLPAAEVPVPAGTTVQLTADLADPDAGDTHTCHVDWQLAAGPGTVTEADGAGTCAASQLFDAPGTYQIVVSVIDPMGATAADTVVINVALVAPPPPPPPTVPPPSQGGSVRGFGRLGVGSGAVAGLSSKEAAVWFDVNVRTSKTFKGPRGGVVIHVPKARWIVVANQMTTLEVKGLRGDVSGRGKLNGRRWVNFLITAIDGRPAGRGTAPDRVRIKVWDDAGMVLDTEPSVPAGTDPAGVPRPGRVIVRP